MPGVQGAYDDNGNFVATQENLGGPGTMYNPYYNYYGWSFTKVSTFAADFIKLREISLAYSINKKSHGFYAVFNYEAEAEIVAELEAAFRLSETVLRWITLADQPVPSIEEEVAEEEVKEEA